MDAVHDAATDPDDHPTSDSPFEVALRDAAGADVSISDTELFSRLDGLFQRAEEERGNEDPAVRALGLEAAIFGWIPWDALNPAFTTPEVHELLAARMSSPSARLRARVGEYLFQQSETTHRRHVGAAAEAGVEWARTLAGLPRDTEQHHMLHAVRALEQAARLALSANQNAVISDACSFIVELVTDAAAHGDAHDAAFLTDAITELRSRLSPAQRDELLRLLTELQVPAVAAVTPANRPLIAGRLLDARRELCLAGRDEEAANACDREYARLLAENAAARADSFVAAMDLEQAITLAERGQADEATLNQYRTQRRMAMQHGMDTIPTVKIRVQVPAELEQARRKMHDYMLTQPAHAFLRRFAGLNVPRRQLLQASVAAARTETPLSTLIPRVSIASAGESVLAGTDDDTLLFEHGLRQVQIGAQVDLRPLWQQRTTAGDLTPAAIIDFLHASGNFDDDALDIIADGINAALAGKLTLAIPLLVTQFEDVLRRLLQRAGHDPGRRNPSDRKVTEEITQSSVLLGLEKREVLTPDQALFLRLVVDDPLGLNLRNRTGHGHIRRADCSVENLLLLLQCYLLVATLNASLPENALPTDDESP